MRKKSTWNTVRACADIYQSYDNKVQFILNLISDSAKYKYKDNMDDSFSPALAAWGLRNCTSPDQGDYALLVVLLWSNAHVIGADLGVCRCAPVNFLHCIRHHLCQDKIFGIQAPNMGGN